MPVLTKEKGAEFARKGTDYDWMSQESYVEGNAIKGAQRVQFHSPEEFQGDGQCVHHHIVNDQS